MSDEYKNHHYVPQWYQKKFMLPGEHEFFYLDLKPESFKDPRGVIHTRKSLKRQGSKKCFVETDLYTAKIKGIESKDIEKYFFGHIDTRGQHAVDYFENFNYPPKDWTNSLEEIMIYMSTQKMRTPKGLSFIGNKIGNNNKQNILAKMIQLQGLYCAIWTEAVWLIADASLSNTKFIISDHPVTVYNRGCPPWSHYCKESNDPDIWLQGTHTIFPLSLDKVLILTNLSWARNPYQSPLGLRPNPNPFRNAIFKFTDIQVLRHLSEQEVREINFIIKNRSSRYIAGAKEEWLYPEKYINRSDWDKFGHGYLLMPDPRALHLGGEIMWGNNDGTGGAMDEYGRRPWDPDYGKESKTGSEHTLYWFQGEFAKLFGPYRRGRVSHITKIEDEKDDEQFHQYHLGLQKKTYKERRAKKK